MFFVVHQIVSVGKCIENLYQTVSLVLRTPNLNCDNSKYPLFLTLFLTVSRHYRSYKNGITFHDLANDSFHDKVPFSLHHHTMSSTKGQFTLLLFASAQTYTNQDTLTLPAPMTLPQLFNHLEENFPGIGKKVLRSCALTVNLEYVDFEYDFDHPLDVKINEKGNGVEGKEGDGGTQGEIVIKAGDEVGIIPPVSSG